MRRIAIAAALTLAACQPAQPLPAPAGPVTLAGEYMFAGDSILATPCLVTLGSGGRPDAAGVHETSAAVDCAAAYPFIADLSGWEEVDAHAIRLRGARGAVLGEFRRGDGRSLRGDVAGQPYALTPIAVRANPS